MTLIALAIAPGIAICIYIYWKDKFEREPKRLLALSFFLGLCSTFPALLIEEFASSFFGFANGNSLYVLGAYTLMIGFAEEGSKYFFTRFFAYRSAAFNEPFDGITYSVMVAMGFATLENIFYVMSGGYGIGMLRMFTAVPAHATFGVIIGYYLGLQKMGGVPRTGLTGLLYAMLLHAAYDFCLMADNDSGMWMGAILSLVIGLRFSMKAIKGHQAASPFKPGSSVS